MIFIWKLPKNRLKCSTCTQYHDSCWIWFTLFNPLHNQIIQFHSFFLFFFCFGLDWGVSRLQFNTYYSHHYAKLMYSLSLINILFEFFFFVFRIQYYNIYYIFRSWNLLCIFYWCDMLFEHAIVVYNLMRIRFTNIHGKFVCFLIQGNKQRK